MNQEGYEVTKLNFLCTRTVRASLMQCYFRMAILKFNILIQNTFSNIMPTLATQKLGVTTKPRNIEKV